MSLILFCDPLTERNRLFDDVFTTRFQPLAPTTVCRDLPVFRPRVDILESTDSNTVTATFELPGMQPDNVTVDVQQNRLTIAGEVEKDDSHEDGGYAVRERRYGKFHRTLQLPFGTKPDDVKAKMENGILTVTFPKTAPEQQPQRISIQ